MEFLKGPLGSYQNYLRHIAFRNYFEYVSKKKLHVERGENSTPSKYEEFRLFLNAIEALNNVIDYFYFENESSLTSGFVDLNQFRKKALDLFDELRQLANLANAYKHCVRSPKGKKDESVPWAKDLQRPLLHISIDLKTESPRIDTEYRFEWPIPEYENILSRAFDFWMKHSDDQRWIVFIG